MGHHDHDGPTGALRTHDLAEPLDPCRIEAGRGLVEEQEARPLNQRAGERDSLALATRVRTEGTLGERAELEALPRRLEGSSGVETVELGRELDVLPAGEVAVTE